MIGQSRRLRPWPALAALIAFSVPAVASAQDCVDWSDSVGQPHVYIELSLGDELWRTAEDSEPFFRVISKVALCPGTGRFYISDNRSCTIHVLGLDGAFERSMPLRGEGPGEVQSLIDFELLDEETLAILSPVGPVITLIHSDGMPRYDTLSRVKLYSEEHPVSNCYFFDAHGGFFIVAGEQGYLDRTFVASFSEWGDYLGDIYNSVFQSDASRLFYSDHDDFILNHKPWTVASNGLVYIATVRNGDGNYSVSAYDLDGVEQFRFCRPYAPYKRSNADVAYAAAAHFGGRNEFVKFLDAGWRVDIPSTAPDVIALTERDDHLWVETSRSIISGNERSYDVFTLEGAFQGTAHLVSSHEAMEHDRIYLFNDRAVLIRGSHSADAYDYDPEAPPLQIICFDLIASGEPN